MSIDVSFTDASKSGPSGPITAWAWDFGDTGTSSAQNPVHTYAAAGTYTVSLTVTGTGGDGTDNITRPVEVTGGVGTGFESVTSWARPSFTPVRTVNFTTKAQLDAAIAGMQAGDLIRYTGSGVLTISSSSTNAYVINNKRPSGTVVIDFGVAQSVWAPGTETADYVAFRYTGSSSFSAFDFNNISNIRIYGGDYSAGANGGIGFGGAVGNTHDCYFWDLYVHDCGTAGLSFIPKDSSNGVNATINNINVRAEAYNWGRKPSADSHTAAPGTGLHGLITADAGGGFTNNTITIYGHNPTTVGSCLEVGSTLSKGSGLIAHNTFYVKAEHFHFHSTQTASNAVNLWGNKDLSTNVFGWIEGNDLYGTVLHSTSNSIASGMVVSHGRHSSTNQNPSDGVVVPFPATYGVVYNDCT